MDSSKIALRMSWLVATILALLPFHALLITWAGSNFGYLDAWRIWKDILLVLMVPPGLWLAWRTPKLKKWLVRSWTTRLFGLYILLHIILGVWALSRQDVNSTALIYALITNLRFITFFTLCLVIASQNDFLRRHWSIILLVPAGAVVIFGLVQKLLLPYDFLRHFGYGKNTIPAYQTVDLNLDYRRLQSTLRGANPLGAYLILVISGLSGYLRKNLKLFGLFTLGAFVVLFFSYSRSAEIGVAIALGLLVWSGFTNKTSSRRIALLVVILLSLAGSAVYSFRNSQPVQETLFHISDSSTSLNSSNADRAKAMKNGVRDVVHQPLGRGPGTAGPASVRNNHPPRIAENYFLQIGQEVGIVGVALFIAINLLVAKELWIRRNDQLAKILLASLIGLTFVNLLSHAWTDDTLSYLWWGLAGMAAAPILNEKHRAR